MFKKEELFKKTHIAYFSMEIGIDEKLPTYSGGLGILAGDTLRSASDLGLPIVGVTLLYKKGFFKQSIKNGIQIEEDVYWQPRDFLEKLPQTVKVTIEGREVTVGAWLYKQRGATGKVLPILFLDVDLPVNEEHDRALSDRLYGGDRRYRLLQEIILGIGGVRMLKEIGLTNLNKYHMNEGHSALLTLELCKQFKEEKKKNKRLTENGIVEHVRNMCVFTTHTPVPAGHDDFDKGLVDDVLRGEFDEFINEKLFSNGKLNMTYIGLFYSKFVNGVAKKHGEVSRRMFPGYHIDSITNGVHSSFWTCEPFSKLFSKYIPGWETDPYSLRGVLSIPDNEVWDAHMEAKNDLIKYVNKNYNVDMQSDVFTIGFARRSAAYKRGDLLISDINRLVHIAEKFDKGIQIIYAGKAHPSDGIGKGIIKKIVDTIGHVKHKVKICYLENYNISVAKKMIPGVDIWLNTPRRPMEASGTSGMKAAHNGVPHFSTLDGWWLEGHVENLTGWSIGIHPDISNDSSDNDDINDLYSKLEYVILPTFYNERDDWTKIMRHTIAINGSFFNTHRMVQQYVLNAYFE